ncbi:Ankyrin-2 (ANK-2) (Ankyrin-B) (Brain ankyrin) (Non-erythroid ankyrin) [Durusdinium trenchii]|uniref:Ankyrin-2 (ANK-2) (Ankyrin-B) (Brain ankyrin) (Non-erythroid ankyrin) n=1 Tax=Durusdinium trenchii TaxID=1381693 RepID=A0ABP0N574_9DINO
MAIVLCWAYTGDVFMELNEEQFDELVQRRDDTAGALKMELAADVLHTSTFRLRLFHQVQDEFIELPDEQRLEPPMRLTLVILGLCPADAQEDGAFLAACRAGDAREVARRVLEPRDPNVANEDEGALHLAARFNHVEVLRLLLDARASCDQTTSNWGETALILAARRGFVESARCLLKSGATRDHARTDRGATALHYAAGGGHLEFVILLVEHQASVDLEMTGLSAGMTAAHVASAAGRVEVLRWLLQNGATKALSPTPMSGLHMAADCSRLEVAHLLVEHLVGHRATLDGTMACGETALHLAAASGSVDIVRLLLDSGASHDAKTVAGFTPWHFASHRGHIEAARVLRAWSQKKAGWTLCCAKRARTA